jgi:glycosyltransferase involved in cell wall biosynthesis
MRIAQVAPLFESVPPKTYGGTERVVSYLTEELVKMGHEVVLYASGDSETRAHLKAICPRALRLDKHSTDPVANHVLLAERIFQDADQYEFIHSHIDYIPYPLYRRMNTPHVTTLHGRLDIPNLYELYQEFDDVPLVSISNYQRLPISWSNWAATVYHGLPPDLYQLNEKQGDYLAFIGRFSPEKGAEFAIDIARQSGMKIKIAAKLDKADQEYYDEVVKPLIGGSHIENVGEIGEHEKNEFLGNAYALLFPINWPEPFGLVMIEAMACGTPIITRMCGAVPEIMEQGVTGYIVDEVSDAVKAVADIANLSRRRCREVFDARFTARTMAENYLTVYDRLIEEKHSDVSSQSRKRHY